MPQVVNPNRRHDIKLALRRAGEDDHLSLEALSSVWGVTKQRFVTKRNEMSDFPGHLPGQGNSYVYPARAALEAMLKHEQRHDHIDRQKAKRQNQILHGTGKRGRAAETLAHHSPQELQILSRMSAEVEQRERDQGLYVPIAEVSQIAGAVFAEISEFVAGITNAIDPHGMLSPEARSGLQDRASDMLLRFNKKMRQMLDPDARRPTNRGKAGRAQRSPARR